jgi:hypothetical protein
LFLHSQQQRSVNISIKTPSAFLIPVQPIFVMYSDYTHFSSCETEALEPESKEEGSQKANADERKDTGL